MFDDSMKFIGKGGLTKNAEISYNNSGTAFLKFSIGVSKSRKIKGSVDYEQISHYFNCVVIGKYGESLLPHLKKGAKVYIVGNLEFSSWEKDGIKHNKVTLHVDELEIIKKAEDSSSNGNNQYRNNGNNQQNSVDESQMYFNNGKHKETGNYNKDYDWNYHNNN